MKNDEIKNEIDEIKKWENKVKRQDLKYHTNRYVYDFQQFQTTRSVGHSFYTSKISIDEAEMDQTNVLDNIVDFNNKSRTRSKEDKIKNEILLIV